jgi:hypothetical protein
MVSDSRSRRARHRRQLTCKIIRLATQNAVRGSLLGTPSALRALATSSAPTASA